MNNLMGDMTDGDAMNFSLLSTAGENFPAVGSSQFLQFMD
jgi:hypothetical protein